MWDKEPVLWRLRGRVADTPGQLARLSAALAGLGGNIRTVDVHPVADGAVDEVLIHVPAGVTERDLIRALVVAGGREATAARADIRDLDDVPTRALRLAADLVGGRTDLVRALRALLGAVEIRWRERPDPSMVDHELTDHAMCLRLPDGGVVIVERTSGGFTPAEFARAHSMVALAESCRTRLRPEQQRASTKGGTDLVVRPADRDDVERVAAFHAQCSAVTRYHRYFGSGPTAKTLQWLLTPALGRSLVALSPSGEVVGMANLMYEKENRGARALDSGELALVVRDDWQRQGVGTALANHAIELADRLGITTLHALTHTDNIAIAKTLRKVGLEPIDKAEPDGYQRWVRTNVGMGVGAGHP